MFIAVGTRETEVPSRRMIEGDKLNQFPNRNGGSSELKAIFRAWIPKTLHGLKEFTKKTVS